MSERVGSAQFPVDYPHAVPSGQIFVLLRTRSTTTVMSPYVYVELYPMSCASQDLCHAAPGLENSMAADYEDEVVPPRIDLEFRHMHLVH